MPARVLTVVYLATLLAAMVGWMWAIFAGVEWILKA
jgi:hypothetical protein